MKIKVTQGQIPVKSIDCYADYPNVKVYRVDSSAKYYVVSCVCGGVDEKDGEYIEVALARTSQTLRAVDVDEPTVVWFKQDGISTWAVESSTARYSAYLVFWLPADPKEVWKGE